MFSSPLVFQIIEFEDMRTCSSNGIWNKPYGIIHIRKSFTGNPTTRIWNSKQLKFLRKQILLINGPWEYIWLSLGKHWQGRLFGVGKWGCFSSQTNVHCVWSRTRTSRMYWLWRWKKIVTTQCRSHFPFYLRAQLVTFVGMCGLWRLKYGSAGNYYLVVLILSRYTRYSKTVAKP